ALATTTSSRPSSAIVRETNPDTESVSETSTSTARHRRPDASTARRVGSTSCGSGGYQPAATSAPASAKTFAVAAPIPEAAPVTSATLPSSLNALTGLPRKQHH